MRERERENSNVQVHIRKEEREGLGALKLTGFREPLSLTGLSFSLSVLQNIKKKSVLQKNKRLRTIV